MTVDRSLLHIAACATAAVLLLIAFDAVVQAGVTRGVARRSASARQADATWRCKLLRDSLPRAQCLADLAPDSP